MVKIPSKFKQLLDFYSTRATETRGQGSSAAENAVIDRFPAGRAGSHPSPAVTDRPLQANMTGHVTLAGAPFDLGFHNGSIRRITKENETLLDRLSGRTFIRTSESRINYRNQSAFSFDNGDEYGLRSVFVPGNRQYSENKVFTDYFFNRLSDEAYISVNIDYPDLNADTTVYEAAALELKIVDDKNHDIIIHNEQNSGINISLENSVNETLYGEEFKIEVNGITLLISYQKITNLSSTPLKHIQLRSLASKKRNSVTVNFGGSYDAAPAEFYSGIREQFLIKLEVHR